MVCGELQILLQFNIFIIRQKIEFLRWLLQKKLRAKSWEISTDKGKVGSAFNQFIPLKKNQSFSRSKTAE